MPQRPERLLDQYFGKAEAEAMRGAGVWPLQPHPCRLEPPWEAFEPRSVTIWDCLLQGWEAPWSGGLLNRLFGGDDTVYRQGLPVVLPEAPEQSFDHLRPVVVEQFPEDESTIPKAEEFLRSLPHLSAPVAFEILGVGPQPHYDHEKSQQILQDRANGKKRRISEAICGWSEPYTLTQFVAHRDDAERIERQLAAHYPNSAVVAASEDDGQFLDRTFLVTRDVKDAQGFASNLGLAHYYCWPLRLFSRLEPDPLGVAIAAMEDLGREQWALLQVLLEPVRKTWAENLDVAVRHPFLDEFLLPDLSDRILREKFAEPLFAVTARILAKRQDVLKQLQGWAEQFAAPPQKFDFLLEDHEASCLWEAVEDRTTYRPGMLLNARELAGLVHLPGRSIVSDRLRQVTSRTRPAEETAPQAGSVLLGENVHRGRRRRARIPAKLRNRHCYIAGASGTGKSTLLLNMILQDITAGHGVGVLDPHGDLIKAVLRRIPSPRIDDVVLFDPADTEYPFALNILEARDETERERIVEETLMALERYFPASWGPRLQRILTFTLLTVLDAIPGATLADVERMLVKRTFREQVIRNCRTQRYVDFWNDEFATMPKNAVDPVLNKVSVFLLNRTVRNIICQRRSAVDFDAVLNEGKIFLANLSTGLLSERIAGTFGSFLVSKLVAAAFRRAALPEEQRRPWYLYVDEFQAFMNVSVGFDRILAEARKYKLVLAGLANQYVGQLSPQVRQAIFGNIGTMVTFRLGTDDARIVEKEMGIFTAEEILSLDVGQAIARAGRSDQSFNIETYPEPPLKGDDPTSSIVAMTRNRYSRPKVDVEAELGPTEDSEAACADSTSPPSGGKKSRRRKSHRGKGKGSQQPPADPSEDDLVD